MRKIVVLGAKGMLGHELLRSLSGVHKVTGLDIDELDIFDLDATTGMLKTLNPDLVIHSAAYTDVDGCELDPDKAHQVNALGSRNVAIGCQNIGTAMVYISTDYVFSGQKPAPYQEWDATGPINVYGTSKLAGENFVRGLCLRHYVVRTSWLYGRHGKNFVDTIARLARERDSLRVVVDQTGSPTWAHDLADKIAELVRKEAYGTYHITNSDTCTWFQFASEIVARLGLETCVEPVTSEHYVRPAKRPANSVLDNYYLRLEGFSQMRSYRQALREYLSS
jgi:dTDP-4-dehydrorhamnose reductase